MLEGKYDEVEDFGLIFHCCYLAVFISVTERRQRDMIVEVLDFLVGYESYLRKRRISVSNKPTGKRRHSLR
jgi:hypothetical protein